jgi:acyl-CoA reductase-like NAD-dependent aldehyde dehydrogenase
MGDREFYSTDIWHVHQISNTSYAAMNPKSTMGSVISQHHLQRIDAIVKRSSKTAAILAGGEPMTGVSELDGFDFSKGSFYPPTVIVDVGIEEEIWQEEVFGPVVVVKRFEVRPASAPLL